MKQFENLKKVFKSLGNKINGIKFINLSSIDGFSICSYKYDESFKVEDEKLSAVTSSIAALSIGTSEQIIGSEFNSTIIETKDGTIILVKTQIQHKECILSLVIGSGHIIGSVRFYANKLAKIIKNSNLPAD